MRLSSTNTDKIRESILPLENRNYIVIKQGEALECWIKQKGASAYKDVRSKRIIELESESLMLTNIQKMSNFKCALIYSKVSIESVDENIKIHII